MLILPMGDFSTLQDIPEMYRHCKSMEHKDMTPFDFITDHLVNIDGLFDKHDNGDEQKPHSPVSNQHISQTGPLQLPATFKLKSANRFFEKEITVTYFDQFIKSEYVSEIFRPPILA